MTEWRIEGWFRAHTVHAAKGWHLRREVRRVIGWRRSARFTYHQIGTNSFQVRAKSGRVAWDVFAVSATVERRVRQSAAAAGLDGPMGRA